MCACIRGRNSIYRFSFEVILKISDYFDRDFVVIKQLLCLRNLFRFLTSIDVEGHECSNMYAEISEILIIKCLVEGFRVRSEKF